MNRKNKAIVWLCIFIFMLVVSVAVATYAIFSYEKEVHGDFEVDVTSKGVDTLTFNAGADAKINATAHNFAPGIGRDLTATTDIEVKLETTNKTATFCYEMYVHLPDEQVFVYSQEGRAELLLNIEKSKDNYNFQKIINNMDITTKTGSIKVPVTIDSNEYVNIISTSRRVLTQDFWKASLTMVWFEDASQEINDYKNYSLTLEAKRVDC